MTPHMQWSRFRTSFQFKLFSIFTLLTFLIACLLSTLYIVREIRTTRHEATEQLQLRTLHLADSIRLPLYAENGAVLKQMAENVAKTAEIKSVVISAADGRALVEVYSPYYSADSADTRETLSYTVEVRSNPLVDSVESAMTGSQDTTSELIGTVRIERGTSDLAHILRKVVVLSTSVAIIFWLAVSGLCYLVFRKLTRSFNTLMSGIQTMQEGDFTSRIEIDSDDEPSWAARAINNLANALQQRGEENARLLAERLDFERQMLHTQKLESLGVMAGGIAHDFNNLLQSILGNMELASRKLGADSEPHKFIDRAMNSATRAALLAGLMLTYVGKGLITKKPLDLNLLVRANADMLRTAATAAVSMELHLSALLPTILADEAYIQQVVMNLISNAAESIVEQPGIVRITTGVQQCDQSCLNTSLLEEKPEPGRFVFVEVCDNGCGMNAETLQRLFDPFFTTKFTGRGLGMSAVMGIMRTHNGALFVESTPGAGTTFRALFPAPETALPTPDPEAAVEEVAPANISAAEKHLSGMALVVDDEKAVLKICAKMVTLCGFTVITAVDGVDAVAKFREHAADIAVVLMDLTMPNMDGLTAMSEIFSLRPDSKIILASGYNQEELGSRITECPPSGFIRKPYNMKELESELKRVVLGS